MLTRVSYLLLVYMPLSTCCIDLDARSIQLGLLSARVGDLSAFFIRLLNHTILHRYILCMMSCNYNYLCENFLSGVCEDLPRHPVLDWPWESVFWYFARQLKRNQHPWRSERTKTLFGVPETCSDVRIKLRKIIKLFWHCGVIGEKTLANLPPGHLAVLTGGEAKLACPPSLPICSILPPLKSKLLVCYF
jgi:hypothetical protein